MRTIRYFTNTNKMKTCTILIALDYSASAKKVAEKGYQLAQLLHADIILLHVIEEVAYYASSGYDPIMGFGGFINVNYMEQSALQQIETEAANYLNKIKELLKDNHIQTMVIKGDITDVILKSAHEHKANLIVLGTHGRKGIEQVLIGSTANSMIKQSETPLYIIPTKHKK